MGKITLAVLCVFLTGSDLNTGRLPIEVGDLAPNTDGHLITYDENGNPISIGPGTASQYLASQGVGAQPIFKSILDEDDMVSDSDTDVASQQSIKAFVTSGTVTMSGKTLTSPIFNGDTSIVGSGGATPILTIRGNAANSEPKLEFVELGTGTLGWSLRGFGPNNSLIFKSQAAVDNWLVFVEESATFKEKIIAEETLTLADGSVTDSGGAISFGDENLTTTGTAATGNLTVTGTGSTTTTFTVGTDLILDDATTTADGAMRFDRTNEDLSIGDGSASQIIHMGAWKTWTPTWINLTLGNGTVSARYTQIGKAVHIIMEVTFGSTTTIDGTGVVFTLPVTSNDATTEKPTGTLVCKEDGASAYFGFPVTRTTTTMRVYVQVASGTYSTEANISATIPFTWGTSDAIKVTATYEAL